MKTSPYTADYLNIVCSLDGDAAGRAALRREIEEGNAYWDGKPQSVSYVPLIFDRTVRDELEETATTLHGILAKIIRRYQADPAYRREFHFDKRIEELLLLTNAYAEPLPFSRVDFLYNEEKEDYVFCEFNTDACGGMIETRELVTALEKSAPYKALSAEEGLISDKTMPVEGWIEKFKALYHESVLKAGGELPERPQVAIVACIDSAYPEKTTLNGFISFFENAGFACSVFDVREIIFDGTHMYGRRALAGRSHVKIDAIWRYTIMVDLLEHWADVQPFIEGVKAGAAVMMGGFSTQIVHDKQVLAVMQRPATRAFLTDAENDFVTRHIPRTMFLREVPPMGNVAGGSISLAAIKAHPEKWVLKPADWYASIDVTVGASTETEEWTSLIDMCYSEKEHPWLIQEYIEPSTSPAIPLYGREDDLKALPKPYNNIFGLYILNGTYSGLYLRQGPHKVIGDRMEGITGSVLWKA